MMIRERALQWLVNNLKEWPEYMAVEVGTAPYIGDTGCSWVVTWEEFSGGLEKQSTVRVGKHPKFGPISDELRITKKNWMDAKQGKENRMMNREEALQWVVSNVKAWPWSKQVLPVIDSPEGWEWMGTGGYWKQLVCSDGLITHDDWYCAKPPAQPAPLTSDEALAWLVENVKVWPEKWPDTKGIKHNGWEWAVETTARDKKVFSFYNPENPNFIAIGKQDWQLAQPEPASHDDGWIEHKGGKCPVGDDVEVEVVLVSGSEVSTLAGHLAWGCTGEGKITKYREISAKPASNKPSWEDAPEGARILVQDKDGSFFFGSYGFAMPRSDGSWEGSGEGEWFSEIKGNLSENWRDTLEYRPTTKDKEKMSANSIPNIPMGGEWSPIPGVDLSDDDKSVVEIVTQKQKEDAILQNMISNLIRIKEITESHEAMKLLIECEELELLKLKEEVSKVLKYTKFNA